MYFVCPIAEYMNKGMRQRQVRFSVDDDERVVSRAQAMGMTVPQWMRSAVLRAIEENKTSDVVRQELRSAKAETNLQIEHMATDLKRFLIEALVGFRAENKKALQEFADHVVDQLPQSQAGVGDGQRKLDELFGNQNNPHQPPHR